METTLVYLTILLLLILAGMISRLISWLPLPFAQIIAGGLTGLFFPFTQGGFKPDVFMLLFIPPLLFNEGWRFPKREFLLNTRPIIMLSIGLVFFTVGGIGYLVHWLVPALPLAGCFALAAALSPTDAVALDSMTRTIGMPERMRYILRGEALLNDASGLVAFKFAVAALLTGAFSFSSAFFNLLVISSGGIIVGIFFTYFFIIVLNQLRQTASKETTIENLLLILLPYATYLAAEHCGFSGILAVVAAGFMLDKVGFLDKTLVMMRIEGRFVWGMLETTLNGVIFILLGLFLPELCNFFAKTTYSLIFYLQAVFLITLTLVILRLLWLYSTLPFEMLIKRHQHQEWHFPNFKIVTALSFGGIRGAIALAAILSFPSGNFAGNLPVRELLISLVAGVVLCSLLVSGIVLPLILPLLKNLIHQTAEEEEMQARIAAAEAGIQAMKATMEQLMQDLNEEDKILCLQTGNSLTTALHHFITSSTGEGTAKKSSIKAIHFEETLRLAGLEGARQALHSLEKNGTINNATMLNVIHQLDLRHLLLLNQRHHSS